MNHLVARSVDKALLTVPYLTKWMHWPEQVIGNIKDMMNLSKCCLNSPRLKGTNLFLELRNSFQASTVLRTAAKSATAMMTDSKTRSNPRSLARPTPSQLTVTRLIRTPSPASGTVHFSERREWGWSNNPWKTFRKMEAEIVRMGINLFHGGEDACGTVRN